MAYDERLAERVRAVMATVPGASEKKMFGGIAIMVGGKMAVGVLDDDLVVRMDPADGERAVSKPGVRPMDFTGRPMTGFLFVGASATKTDAALRTWVEGSLAYVATLPEKKRKSRVTPQSRAAAPPRSPRAARGG